MGMNPQEMEINRLMAENARLISRNNSLQQKLLIKGMTTKELLDLMKDYPSVKTISVVPGKDRTLHIEFFDRKPEMKQEQRPIPMPSLIPGIPPDDIMLFAATEDPEEAMKERSE